VNGKPGIWFFSLDTNNPFAVQGARRLFRVPYHRSEQSAEEHGEGLRFKSRRKDGNAAAATFDADFRPTGALFNATPGSLEWFLAERYCLYTVDEQLRVYRGDIHHPPWPLHPAEAEIRENTMARPLGLELEGPPLLHFAPLQDVVVWHLERT
jgi:hypothetical protein